MSTSMPKPKLWTAADLAEYLGLSVDWIYKHNAEIPHLKIGKPCRYDPNSRVFQDWLAGYGINMPAAPAEAIDNEVPPS